MVLSAVRCTLTYLVFPFALPFVGITTGVGPGVGLVLGPIAIAANIFSIHRLWSLDHRYKVLTSALNVAMAAALLVLFVGDVNALFA